MQNQCEKGIAFASNREYLGSITAPILAVQGVDDEYGTMEQVQSIARAASDVTVLELEACGHSPQRDQPTKVLTAFECAPGCSHNGLALTKQKTFMIACTADPGAILEVELVD